MAWRDMTWRGLTWRADVWRVVTGNTDWAWAVVTGRGPTSRRINDNNDDDDLGFRAQPVDTPSSHRED